MPTRNWAGNLTYQADRAHTPTSMDELQELVVASQRLKALGAGHSFNDIADFAGGAQVDVSHLPRRLDIDSEAATVTVSAASRYGDIAEALNSAGWALENLASLPHASVIGSVSTATHGSGETHPSLSSAVSALELVTGDGEVRSYSRSENPDVFPGVVVNLGALGVATTVTLDLVPRFDVRQDVFERLDWDHALEHFDEIQQAGYSVSMFTNWSDPVVDQVWVKTKTEPGITPTLPSDLFGAPVATVPHHPADWMGETPENCTEQLGHSGPWYDRLPHFRLGFTPSVGRELQTEYLMPRRHAIAALGAIRGLGDLITPLLIISEIRTVASDDLWMSPFYGVDSVAVHMTWRQRQRETEAILPVIEEALSPYDARPHWAKLFHRSTDFDALVPRLSDFRSLVTQLDPAGKFRNAFVDRILSR